MKTTICVCALVLVANASLALGAIIPAGPAYPAPGGNLASGSGLAGNAGGRTVSYSGFNVTGLSNLWQGLDLAFPPGAGLDGSLHSLSFGGVSGATATWSGSTSWTNPTTLATGTFPIKLDISLVSGPPTWTTLPLAGYTFPAIGAVLDNSTGANYAINILFSANVGSGFVPINTIPQLSSPAALTQSSFSLGFYSVAVPEPSTYVLGGMALVGLLAFRRRKLAR